MQLSERVWSWECMQEFYGPVPSIDQFEAGKYTLAQPSCGGAGADLRQCLQLPRPTGVDPRVAMTMKFAEFPPEVCAYTCVNNEYTCAPIDSLGLPRGPGWGGMLIV